MMTKTINALISFVLALSPACAEPSPELLVPTQKLAAKPNPSATDTDTTEPILTNTYP